MIRLTPGPPGEGSSASGARSVDEGVSSGSGHQVRQRWEGMIPMTIANITAIRENTDRILECSESGPTADQQTRFGGEGGAVPDA
jgi:hypothetical protein